MFLISLVGEVYISVSYAIIINVATPRVRAFQTAWMMCVTFIAGSISTVTLGFLYTSLEALRISLLIFTVFGSSMAAIMFLIVAKYYPNDLKSEDNVVEELIEKR